MRRVVLISSASASGKTTVAKELARRLDAPCHELDALNHGVGWTEATPAELRAAIEPLLAGERWVIDGAYRGKVGISSSRRTLRTHRAHSFRVAELPASTPSLPSRARFISSRPTAFDCRGRALARAGSDTGVESRTSTREEC